MLKPISNARLPAASIFSRANSMMDTAGPGVGVGSGTGDGGGVGSGMFDAGTGPLIGTLVGAADVAVGVSASDTGVGLPVGRSSSHADIRTAASAQISPKLARRIRPEARRTRTATHGPAASTPLADPSNAIRNPTIFLGKSAPMIAKLCVVTVLFQLHLACIPV